MKAVRSTVSDVACGTGGPRAQWDSLEYYNYVTLARDGVLSLSVDSKVVVSPEYLVLLHGIGRRSWCPGGVGRGYGDDAAHRATGLRGKRHDALLMSSGTVSSCGCATGAGRNRRQTENSRMVGMQGGEENG